MPLREYRCRKCGRVIERLEKMNERGTRRRHMTLDGTSTCRGLVDRLVSAPGVFDLRGPGFYKNGFPKAAR